MLIFTPIDSKHMLIHLSFVNITCLNLMDVRIDFDLLLLIYQTPLLIKENY
jgi:hypothetical protein